MIVSNRCSKGCILTQYLIGIINWCYISLVMVLERRLTISSSHSFVREIFIHNSVTKGKEIRVYYIGFPTVNMRTTVYKERIETKVLLLVGEHRGIIINGGISRNALWAVHGILFWDWETEQLKNLVASKYWWVVVLW